MNPKMSPVVMDSVSSNKNTASLRSYRFKGAGLSSDLLHAFTVCVIIFLRLPPQMILFYYFITRA